MPKNNGSNRQNTRRGRSYDDLECLLQPVPEEIELQSFTSPKPVLQTKRTATSSGSGNARTSRLWGIFYILIGFLLVFVTIGFVVDFWLNSNSADHFVVSPIKAALSPFFSNIPDYDARTAVPEPPVVIAVNESKAIFRSMDNHQKTILFWTPYFSEQWHGHFQDFGGNLQGSSDPSQNLSCSFTTDRAKLDTADAIVFHGRNFNFGDLPSRRTSNQIWAYYNMESPPHCGFGDDQFNRANALGLNWTMTYNHQSDILIPYFKIVERQNKTKIALDEVDRRVKNFTDGFTNRPKTALWFVSNCGTQSQREKIVEHLSKLGIETDLFGGCSGKQAEPLIEEMGAVKFYSQYKFYLSFENSLCEDYMTEKFGKGLSYSIDYGLIPLVYGGLKTEDYLRHAPNGSFIDINSFETVEQLARRLIGLSETSGWAAAYYKWHRDFESVDMHFPRIGFTNMCQKMFAEEATNCRADPSGKMTLKRCETREATVNNLKERIGECRQPKFL